MLFIKVHSCPKCEKKNEIDTWTHKAHKYIYKSTGPSNTYVAQTKYANTEKW